MQVVKRKDEDIEGWYNYKFGENEEPNLGGYPISIEVSTDSSNCKLSYIHEIGQIKYINDKNKLLVIEDLLKKCKGAVIFNTKEESVADFINANYETYYYNKVPIGYHNGYQYHICIRNNIKVNDWCRKPEKATNIDVNDFKADLENKIRTILKAKRRKADYVEELIGTL